MGPVNTLAATRPPVTPPTVALADVAAEPAPERLHDRDLSQALQQMQPVALSELEDLSLYRRVDTKYLLPRTRLVALLSAAREDYGVLEIDGMRLQRYETLYYDTPDMALYLAHHNGMRRRFKVRTRRYLESELAFLEIKVKQSGDETLKLRERTPELLTALDGEARDYIAAQVGTSPVNPCDLRPMMWNEFSRITLASTHWHERVTLDLNVLLMRGARSICLDDWVVVEVKSTRAGRDSTVVRTLRRFGLRPMGFSKYCIGVASLMPEIKHNRFNRKLRLIQSAPQEVLHVD